MKSNIRSNKNSKYKKISPLQGDLIEKIIRRKHMKKKIDPGMTKHNAIQNQRSLSGSGYINATSGRINVNDKRCSSVLLNKKPKIK